MTPLLLFILAAATPAATAPANPPAPPREASAILADYADAVGGKAAWKRLKSVHVKRKLVIEGQGAQGDEEHWATADGKGLSVSTIEGVGTFKQGSDGHVYWSKDPVYGLRKLHGAEEEEARIAGAWNAEADLARPYTGAVSIAAPAEAPAGAECVQLSKRVGNPTTICFDGKTHLRVLQMGTQPSAAGDVPYRVTFEDWRPVNGIKTWFHERMVAGPMIVEARTQEIVLDEKIPASTFKMPQK